MGGKVRERSNKVHRFSIIHLSILLWKTDCVCVCVCVRRERERIVCLLAYIPCRQLVTSGTFWAIVLIRQRGSVGWKVMVFCGSKGQTWRIVFRSCIYSCYVKPGMNVEREREYCWYLYYIDVWVGKQRYFMGGKVKQGPPLSFILC